VQVSIRLIDLAQKYRRLTTLLEIANRVGTLLSLDDATKNHIVGHFARILIDLDIFKRIFDEIMIEHEGFFLLHRNLL